MYYHYDGHRITEEEFYALDRKVGASIDRTAWDGGWLEGGIEVSTIWLGVSPSGPSVKRPKIFETLVFGGPLDKHRVLTPTIEEAQEAHDEMVDAINEALALQRIKDGGLGRRDAGVDGDCAAT